ncbi:glycoside hydrolase family 3 C-terminal domain-containing protein [Lapidilactobacillus mulanensis]|uniref:Glycoside hydrolase family 3 C-terminal domain-containing protein n=1 Tax=Lapidilactobacillus mulanensis TaxID=2485999 RepID=A0ABW4DTK6_9LACO|nr:glycoside hydrolase family 3 protein [Lapidilactobacillus mulanensis]
MDESEKQAINIVAQLSLDEKIGLMTRSQRPVPRFGLKAYHIGGEAAHGIVAREDYQTTSFPIPLTFSQTWNPELLKKVGSVISDEARALYNTTGQDRWLTPWAPTIDLERDPFWGRNEEGYGEDPYLTGTISVGLIKGIQNEAMDGSLKAVAAPKHFYANNNEQERGSRSNSITERMKHEYYLKPFMLAFRDGGAQSMMTAYSGINGIPAMESPDVRDYVKQKWQMKGFIVTDGGAPSINIDDYHYYDQMYEVVADALHKGIDCFVDEPETIEPAIKEAYQRGLITDNIIDQAVVNILKVRIRLGQLTDSTVYDDLNENDIGTKSSDELVKDVYAQGTVLLENHYQALPIHNSERILLTGPIADRFYRDWYATTPMNTETLLDALSKQHDSNITYVNSNDIVKIHLNKGYLAFLDDQAIESDRGDEFELERWGENEVFLRQVKSQRYVRMSENNKLILGNTTVYDWVIREALYLNDQNQLFGLLHEFNSDDINSMKALRPDEHNTVGRVEVIVDGLKAVEKQAKLVDKIIFVGGNQPMINGRETEDRQTLALPVSQQQLILMLQNQSAKLIGVLLTGYPFLTDKFNFDALLSTGYAGQSMGTALAEILYGKREPTGKLSQTWYDEKWHDSSIFDYDIEKSHKTYQYVNRQDVHYAFGYGLNYSGKLTLQNLRFAQDKLRVSSVLPLTIDVLNPNRNLTTDTVQIYLNFNGNDDVAARQQLIAYKKITLSAKDKVTLTFNIRLEDFSWFDPRTNGNYLPTGAGNIVAGFSSDDRQQIQPVEFINERATTRLFTEKTSAKLFDDYENIELTSRDSENTLVKIGINSKLVYKEVDLQRPTLSLRYYADEAGELQIIGDNRLLGTIEFTAKSSLQTAAINVPIGIISELKFISNQPIEILDLENLN